MGGWTFRACRGTFVRWAHLCARLVHVCWHSEGVTNWHLTLLPKERNTLELHLSHNRHLHCLVFPLSPTDKLLVSFVVRAFCRSQAAELIYDISIIQGMRRVICYKKIVWIPTSLAVSQSDAAEMSSSLLRMTERSGTACIDLFYTLVGEGGFQTLG